MAEEHGGIPESLRAAIERTIAATGEQAAGTRERAQEWLDEVARRGQEASSELTHRFLEALQDRRLATGEDVRAIQKKLAALERKVAALEKRVPAAKKAAARKPAAKKAPAKKPAARRSKAT